MQFFTLLACALALVAAGAALPAPSCKVQNIMSHATVPQGFCPFYFASGLNTPRGLTVASNGDVLVLERGTSTITALYTSPDHPIESKNHERVALAKQDGINNAVVIEGDYLYASSPTDVYRWKYDAGDRFDLGPSTHVLGNIPCCHHVTRAIRFDGKGMMYVQVGSNSNVDPDSTHSRIKRFSLPADDSKLPLDWDKDGEIFADGLRNEAGIRFDPKGRLWGVENGVDELYRDDLGGDIHQTNPGEELNLFDNDNIGKFYGYPYCWSEYDLGSYGKGPGTQWAQPDFMPDVTDEWCQNTSNVVPPKYVSTAHMAPMDIIFWDNDDVFFNGHMNAFVSFHGSWNADPAVGYRVDHFSISNDTNTIESEPFLQYVGPGATGSNWIRPVGLGIGPCAYGVGSCLFIVSDATNEVIGIGYDSL